MKKMVLATQASVALNREGRGPFNSTSEKLWYSLIAEGSEPAGPPLVLKTERSFRTDPIMLADGSRSVFLSKSKFGIQSIPSHFSDSFDKEHEFDLDYGSGSKPCIFCGGVLKYNTDGFTNWIDYSNSTFAFFKRSDIRIGSSIQAERIGVKFKNTMELKETVRKIGPRQSVLPNKMSVLGEKPSFFSFRQHLFLDVSIFSKGALSNSGVELLSYSCRLD